MTTVIGLVAALLLLVGITAYGRRQRQGSTTDSVARRRHGEIPAAPKRPLRRRALVTAGAGLTTVAAVLAGPGLRDADRSADEPVTSLYAGTQTVANPERPVVVAAGDISCPTGKRQRSDNGATTCSSAATAELVRSLDPDAVLTLGDQQYPRGELSQFLSAYAKTWGTFRDMTFPVPGNHEYGTPGAKGYYGYFGARAGEPDKGYYSYDLGPWHIVALNSECEHVGGCDESSPQARWLRRDLADHPQRCTLAYWHQPRFSSGAHGNNRDVDFLWRIVAAAKTDLVLNGHDHSYERFMPMNAEGQPDPENGTVEMVVGTGGVSHYKFHHPQTTSLQRIPGHSGVLRVELAKASYSFEFKRAPGGAVLDSGSHRCR